jgi:hypothetical protein
MDAVKLAFPLEEFAFVTILGKLNVKSSSYFFSNGPPLLVLIFVSQLGFFR